MQNFLKMYYFVMFPSCSPGAFMANTHDFSKSEFYGIILYDTTHFRHFALLYFHFHDTVLTFIRRTSETSLGLRCFDCSESPPAAFYQRWKNVT